MRDCYFLFFIFRIATIKDAVVKITINSSYVLISIILSDKLGSDGARPPTTWVNILYSSSNKAVAYATASIHNSAYITAMRITSSQSAYRSNLSHGFQHISMSTRKFPVYLKPFKNKIVDDSLLTVQIRHKTVKLEMFAFIIKLNFVDRI